MVISKDFGRVKMLGLVGAKRGRPGAEGTIKLSRLRAGGWCLPELVVEHGGRVWGRGHERGRLIPQLSLKRIWLGRGHGDNAVSPVRGRRVWRNERGSEAWRRL